MDKVYKCSCGKEYDKPNSFNAHKSHCKVHFLNKYGSLDYFSYSHKKRGQTVGKILHLQSEKRKNQKNQQWILDKHTCERCGKIMTSFYGSGRFCSIHCANSKECSEKTKELIKESFKNRRKIIQKEKEELKIKYDLNPNYCVSCGNRLSYNLRHRKTCCKACLDKLHYQQGVETAKRNNKSRNRRSKNEIMFCKKCENYFEKENVLHNEPIFNGWDADVILLDYKLAILWNGPWHYRKMSKTHSLIQAQNRDRIKLNEIKSNYYNAYIIKDMGSFNKEKVELEFSTLLSFLGFPTSEV